MEVFGCRVSESGVAPSTVLFYERVGLLSPVRRADNGYRLFGRALVDLVFINPAKGSG